MGERASFVSGRNMYLFSVVQVLVPDAAALILDSSVGDFPPSRCLIVNAISGDGEIVVGINGAEGFGIFTTYPSSRQLNFDGEILVRTLHFRKRGGTTVSHTFIISLLPF